MNICKNLLWTINHIWYIIVTSLSMFFSPNLWFSCRFACGKDSHVIKWYIKNWIECCDTKTPRSLSLSVTLLEIFTLHMIPFLCLCSTEPWHRYLIHYCRALCFYNRGTCDCTRRYSMCGPYLVGNSPWFPDMHSLLCHPCWLCKHLCVQLAQEWRLLKWLQKWLIWAYCSSWGR